VCVSPTPSMSLVFVQGYLLSLSPPFLHKSIMLIHEVYSFSVTTKFFLSLLFLFGYFCLLVFRVIVVHLH
jgi:hypothetical protein